jgi:hypothetical protein
MSARMSYKKSCILRTGGDIIKMKLWSIEDTSLESSRLFIIGSVMFPEYSLFNDISL